ncbi:MAG: glycosyltransferase family 2 protein [Candidatus Omnitrophica bacterium]|nr:glycosyltransferase family 2 protein [Candidatus Omnitrophota bacterium]
MKTRLSFSAVIITKNAEAKIRNCLESIKWADQVVVVDGFSTDSTVDICKEYGAKIVQRKFEGFDKERNAGIEHASGDWILQLDADEVVSEDMRKAVKEVLSGDEKYNAYKFRRQNFFLGKAMRYGGWYHYSAHFLRKGKAHYEGSIHETLVVDGPIGKLEAAVEHYPFDNISDFIRRQNRYTNLQSQRMLDDLGIKDDKFIKKNLLKRMRKVFWKTYIKKKGFKEGMHGLVFSILFVWVEFIKWAKYWELVSKK